MTVLAPARATKARSHRVAEIWLAADDVLRQAYGETYESDLYPPVDIDAIIEKTLGLNLEIADVETTYGVRADGAISIPDRRITIDSRLEDNPRRLRFTEAHEGGHWVVHRDKRQLFLDSSLDEHLYTERRKCEHEANQFAAQVLMPTKPLLYYIRKIAELHRMPFKNIFEFLAHRTQHSDYLWKNVFMPHLTGSPSSLQNEVE